MVFEEVCLEIRERDPEKSSKCIRQVFVLGTCAGQTDTSLALAEVTLQCRHAHGMVSAAERGQRGRVWGNSFAHSAREKAPCGLSQGQHGARGAGESGRAQVRAATGLRWAGLARLASLRGSNTQARAERRRRGDGWRREPRRLGWGRDQGLGIFLGS